ncbi:MAG: chorismate synthase [Dehalococcoidia bacterium]|nr:chorismate synthase [Dehalococcoidia bacterium]
MFRFLTAGESHGKALLAIVEGAPAGLALSEDYISGHMARRQAGYGRSVRQQIEKDRAEIISGVRHGLTLGSPISLLVQNKVWADWQEEMSVAPVAGDSHPVTRLRPGHADLAGAVKYHTQDVRDILERSSARETAARVAVGAIARRFLEKLGMEIRSRTLSIGEHGIGNIEQGRWHESQVDWDSVEASPVRCDDPATEKAMVEAIDRAREAGDTLGGVFQVTATGAPMGLGSHVQWDRRLSGRIAQAIMSIQAVKGVEIGMGFGVARLPGSQAHDLIEMKDQGGGLPGRWRRPTNRAGGMEGGMTNGEPIVVQGAVKPIATLLNPLPSVDLITGQTVKAHYERSDICIVPAAGVVGEAMLAIVLAEAVLEKFGGDHVDETRRNLRAYMEAGW